MRQSGGHPMVEFIKIEDSPPPPPTPTPLPEDVLPTSSPIAAAHAPAAATGPAQPSPDPKDPEGFLSRCSGHNKRTGQRCAAPVGAKASLHARNSHATYLPTCRTHRDQQSFAGWCQFTDSDGERCGRLFRWTPPNFQFCHDHIGHPSTPCYFFRLPTELRQEIFSYLLPSGPIGSSTAPVHLCPAPPSPPFIVSAGPTTGQLPSGPPPLPPVSALLAQARSRRRPVKWRASAPSGAHSNSNIRTKICDLFLVSRQVYLEAKEILYSTVSFTIDIRKDGTFMCGRRLLEPKRPDGKPHYELDSAEALSRRFISTFDFASVKNYNVHILVENESSAGGMLGFWDEEVEIYDIRDYVSVAVSGILSKARELCKLNIRVALSKFDWTEDQWLPNIERLVGPLKKLQNVRQPRFLGVWEGTTSTPWMISMERMSTRSRDYGPWRTAQICSVPSLPTRTMLFGPDHPGFDMYRKALEDAMSQPATQQLHKPPIRAMFTEFKQFYAKLFAMVPEIQRAGRHAFLHRARVAREDGDVKAFRELRNELILYWNMYLDREEAKKDEMNKKLCQMLNADTYPSSDAELESTSGHTEGQSSSSPICLDIDGMKNDGIPMQSNYTPHRGHVYNILVSHQLSSWMAPPMGMNIPPTSEHRSQQQYMMQKQLAAQNQLFSPQANAGSSTISRPNDTISSIRNHPIYPLNAADFTSTSPTTIPEIPDIIEIPDDFLSSTPSSSSGRPGSSARNHSISSTSTTATTVDGAGWDNAGSGFVSPQDLKNEDGGGGEYLRGFAGMCVYPGVRRVVDDAGQDESEGRVKRRKLDTGFLGNGKGKGKAVVIELD